MNEPMKFEYENGRDGGYVHMGVIPNKAYEGSAKGRCMTKIPVQLQPWDDGKWATYTCVNAIS